REILTCLNEVHAISAVPIPACKVHRDNASTGFDESPRETEVANHSWRAIAFEGRIIHAVALEDARIFLRQVERIGQAVRCQNAHRLASEFVESLHRTACIGVSAESIERAAQLFAVL